MNEFTGTRHLVRLALRRDRIVLPIWVLVLAVIPGATASTYEQFYPDTVSRMSLQAGSAANPSTNLIYGPAFDLTTPGGYSAWKYLTFLSLFLALACIFSVTRHTRQEEDTGRQELLASTVTGRYAGLTAALIVSAVLAVATGLLAAITLLAAGLPTAGSLLFGVALALSGLVFGGVAGIAAQLVEYSRTANGLACAVLGVFFMVRGVGDSATDIG